MKSAIRLSVIILLSIILTGAMYLLVPGDSAPVCVSGNNEVSLTIESFDEVNKVINVKWHNNSQETIMPKNGCIVYKEVNGQWELLDATPATLMAVYILPGEVYDDIYRVSHIDMSAPGKYMIETEFSMSDNSYKMNVEFNLR